MLSISQYDILKKTITMETIRNNNFQLKKEIDPYTWLVLSPGLMGSNAQDDFLCDEAVECVNDTAQAYYKPIFEKDETRKVRVVPFS